jgi:hypothetical protein
MTAPRESPATSELIQFLDYTMCGIACALSSEIPLQFLPDKLAMQRSDLFSDIDLIIT